MTLDKGGSDIHEKATANAHAADIPAKRGSLPAHNEQLVSRYRASIMCSERCTLLLTIEEVAQALRIDLEDARQLVATKQLASVIIAEQELVLVRELVEFVDDYSAISKRSSL